MFEQYINQIAAALANDKTKELVKSVADLMVTFIEELQAKGLSREEALKLAGNLKLK